MLDKVFYGVTENNEKVVIMYDYDNDYQSFINYNKNYIFSSNDLTNAFSDIMDRLLDSKIKYIYSLDANYMGALETELYEWLSVEYKRTRILTLLLAIEKYKEDNCL